MRFLRPIPVFLAVLALFSGCSTPPPPAPVVEVPDLVVGNLVYRKDGFMDARTGWVYPQTFLGQLTANQAWDKNSSLIGITYTAGMPGPELAMAPTPVPPNQLETGVVSIMTYPVGFLVTDRASIPDAGNLPLLLGLGHGQADSLDEFWEYQHALEQSRYNLWKLVKLADADAPNRIFHSLLVLKKHDWDKSDAVVVTLGQVEGVYTLVVLRKYVRSKEDVDQFGEWAYAILSEMGLAAVTE